MFIIWHILFLFVGDIRICHTPRNIRNLQLLQKYLICNKEFVFRSFCVAYRDLTDTLFITSDILNILHCYTANVQFERGY